MEETLLKESVDEKSTSVNSSNPCNEISEEEYINTLGRKRIKCYHCKKRYAQIGIVTTYFAINNREQIKQNTEYICGVCAITTVEQARFEKV